jgi:hypothetical protein
MEGLHWILFSVVTVIIFCVAIYFFKNSNRTPIELGDRLKDKFKTQLTDTANNLFEKVFFKDPAKKKRVNKTENKCRSIIEKIFNRSFPSIRPDFLRNPATGKNLELDCYNEKLGIAIEYNGVQHYKYSPFFHRSKKDFHSQVHRDDWKRKVCREKGIKLIEIPYWVTEDNLEDFIRNKLSTLGVNV